MNRMINILILCLTAGITTYAQFGSEGAVDARSMSLGKSYNAYSNGVYSIGINPANLIFMEEGRAEFQTHLPMPSVSLRSGTDFLSLQEFNYFFGGENGDSRYLNEADKQKFNELFENGGFLYANLSANHLSAAYNPGIKYGSFGFSVQDIASLKLMLPESFVELSLFGNERGKVYDLTNGYLQGWWLRSYSLSYAKEIGVSDNSVFQRFGIGLSVKLVHGFSYIGTEKNSTSFSTGELHTINGKADFLAYSAFSDNFGVKYDFDDENKNSKFSFFPSPAGTGIGIDIGIAAAIGDALLLSLSATDIGGITWTKNVAEFSSTGVIKFDDITDPAQRDSLIDKLTGTSKPLGEYKTGLPTTVRLGISYFIGDGEWNFPGSLLLVFDYNQGMNNLPANTTTPRISTGVEWKPGAWIPYIRTGFSIGGVIGFNWSFGLGFNAGPLEISLATSDIESILLPSYSRKTSLAVSSRWRL